MASVWARTTGTRTQVGVTRRSGWFQIFRASSMTLRSSPLTPESGSTAESWLKMLKAQGSAKTRGLGSPFGEPLRAVSGWRASRVCSCSSSMAASPAPETAW